MKIPPLVKNLQTKMYIFDQSKVELNKKLECLDKGGVFASYRIREASLPGPETWNGRVYFMSRTTRIKDPGLSKSSHELEPQEFQVNMNGEEARLGRSLDTRSRLLFTTDLKAVGL